MFDPSPCAPTRSLALLALAALAALAVPAVGRASCGSHVRSSSQAEARPCTPGVDCPHEAPRPAPCFGPHCRAKQDSIPPAPPAPAPADQWGILSVSPLAPADAGRFAAPRAWRSRALHVPTVPDPPPRPL